MTPSQAMPAAPVRVGVVGAGSWATLAHIPAVIGHPNAELVGLADPDARRLERTAAHFGIAVTTADHHELISAGLDALVIATPHTSHYPIACDALDAGLHILVEKPLTITAREARDLAERAHAADRHLVAGYTFNFSPSSVAARDLVQSGELGDITLISCLFASSVDDLLRGLPGDQEPYVLGGPRIDTYSEPALAGGGQGQTQVTHAAEMLLWVTGLTARRVSALMANCGAAVDVVDAMSFELDNGALGTIASTGGLRSEQLPQHELRYYGTDGILLQDLVTGRVQLVDRTGEIRELAPGHGALEIGDGYQVGRPVECLIELVRGSAENLAPAQSAVATVELLEAAYQSAAQGGIPVLTSELD